MKTEKQGSDQIVEVPLASVVESKLNPRKFNDPEKLKELAESIKNEGLKQPITVRPLGDKFETIIGSRRVAAHKLLKLETIKAIIEDMDDSTARTIMLIENLQREDLTELEEGIMYQELFENLRVPIREIARRIGKLKDYVDQRYLIAKKLSPAVKLMVEKGVDGTDKLEYTSAVKIATLPHQEQKKLAERTVTYGLTPEQVDGAIKGAEELADTLDKLPDDQFKKSMEEKYLPQKFQPNALPELQTEILKEKNLWVDTPAFEKKVVPLMTTYQQFQKQYPERSFIIKWDGTEAGNKKALAEFTKLLKEDKLKWEAFIVRI